MDTNTTLTIVGIAATVVLGAGAIYLAVRYSRQVGIAYVEDSCLALIDDITQGIGDLEIRFKDSPVSQNIVLLKGYIVNTGKRDISPAMVEKPLRIIVPEGFEWIDCQITERAKDLQVEVAGVATDSVAFNIGLLKTHEFFKFDALVTVPSDDEETAKVPTKAPNIKLRKVLAFDHRIADTHDIQRLRMSDLRTGSFLPPRMADALSDQRLPRVLRLYFSMSSSFWMPVAIILIGIAVYFLITFGESKRLAYEIVGPDNKAIVVNTRVEGDQIELRNGDGYSQKMSSKAFDVLAKTTVLQSPDSRPAWILSGFYVGLGVLMLIAWGFRYVRSRKYRFILRLSDS